MRWRTRFSALVMLRPPKLKAGRSQSRSWGNLSDDNKATLVSTGTSFTLKDDLKDVWGEVSAGVNFFNPAANTSLFAKVDVTARTSTACGNAGMRVTGSHNLRE